MSLLLLLLLLVWTYPPPTAAALTAASDVAALSALKASITPSSIPTWSCLASWNFSSDPCRPSNPTHFLCGLSCSGSYSVRVTAISLDPAGYSSPFLPSSLSNLTLLSHLSLADNSFGGPIPPSLAALSSLRTLVLSGNSFSGNIPDFLLSNLSSLDTIDLSRNALSGPLPRSLAALSSLTSLDLSFNRLSGNLPESLPPNLFEMSLRGNSFTGGIKRSAFGALFRLEVAELAANRLDGKLEGWFLLLPSLQQVDLANNSLTSIEVMWPTVGAGGGELLVALDLSFNRIEGKLPASLAGFPSLAALSVRHNRLRGRIPWQYLKAKKGAPFRRLFLDGNFLRGKVEAAPEMLKDVAGSFGDNCLEGCPWGLKLCSPGQKPQWVCQQEYGNSSMVTAPPPEAAGGRGRIFTSRRSKK